MHNRHKSSPRARRAKLIKRQTKLSKRQLDIILTLIRKGYEDGDPVICDFVKEIQKLAKSESWQKVEEEIIKLIIILVAAYLT